MRHRGQAWDRAWDTALQRRVRNPGFVGVSASWSCSPARNSTRSQSRPGPRRGPALTTTPSASSRRARHLLQTSCPISSPACTALRSLGTLRDSLVLLAVALEQQTELQPTRRGIARRTNVCQACGLMRLTSYRTGQVVRYVSRCSSMSEQQKLWIGSTSPRVIAWVSGSIPSGLRASQVSRGLRM